MNMNKKTIIAIAVLALCALAVSCKKTRRSIN